MECPWQSLNGFDELEGRLRGHHLSRRAEVRLEDTIRDSASLAACGQPPESPGDRSLGFFWIFGEWPTWERLPDISSEPGWVSPGPGPSQALPRKGLKEPGS